MKKIYLSKIRWAVVFLLRSTTAWAKKNAAKEEVLDESGNRRPSLKLILNRVEVGITNERNTNFSLTAKPVHIWPFIQFTHLEFRSLN